MGDYSSITNTTNKLVRQFVSKRSSILELGCGTGNILKSLPKYYDLHGLDNSEGMLSIAQNQVPNANFYQDDMTSFSLSRKFDAILCIFDSINHLTTFPEWKKLFSNVSKHLSDEGIFIFDMNTLVRLETLSTFDANALKLNSDTVAVMKVNKDKENLYYVKFQLIEDIKKKDIIYTEEKVYESSFPLDKVEQQLKENFTILKRIDPYRKRITNKSGRVFYVCKLN